MATITFFQDGRSEFPNSQNMVSVDGGCEFPILGNMFANYKLGIGNHTVVVTSSNGESWTVSDYVGFTDCLNIKVEIDEDRNIVDVMYQVAKEHSLMALLAKKLPR